MCVFVCVWCVLFCLCMFALLFGVSCLCCGGRRDVGGAMLSVVMGGGNGFGDSGCQWRAVVNGVMVVVICSLG